MNSNDKEDIRSVALYWDFENIHAGLVEAKYGEGAYAKQDNRFRVQEPLIDVQALVELGASFGPVAINRAYGNWQYFGRYRDTLLQNAVELIEVPDTDVATKASETKDASPPPPADPAAEMLKRAVRLLAETKGEAWVNKGSVWHMIKRLDATFDPKDHGHANFAEMVKAMETIVETKKGETDHVLRVR